ncbi:outer membrane protein assembly factor BamD [Ignavibacteriales bacterium]
MKKILIPTLFALIFITGCSLDVDRSALSPEERFKYALSLFEDESYLEAITEFESILIQYPGSSIAADAQYYLAMSRFKRDEFLMSAYEFSKLINTMRASQYIKDAQFMLADSYYELSPVYSLDQKYSEKAIEEFQAFINFFPADPKVEEAERKIQELNDKLAQKMYSNGVTYENMGMLGAAIDYYGYLVEKYHDSKLSSIAAFDKIRLLVDRKRYKEALKDTELFLSRYKGDKNYSKVESIRADLLKLPQLSVQ